MFWCPVSAVQPTEKRSVPTAPPSDRGQGDSEYALAGPFSQVDYLGLPAVCGRRGRGARDVVVAEVLGNQRRRCLLSVTVQTCGDMPTIQPIVEGQPSTELPLPIVFVPPNVNSYSCPIGFDIGKVVMHDKMLTSVTNGRGKSSTSMVTIQRKGLRTMIVGEIEIKNFRGIRHLSLKLDETTVLIGENNTGKSTILGALESCLSWNLTRRSGAFSEYDYHLPEKDSQPIDSEGIEITLRFLEQVENEWPDEVLQALPQAVQAGDDGKQSIIFRVQSRYDEVRDDFVTSWSFLDLAGNELIAAQASVNLIALQQLAPVFYLSALRDSAQEFRPRGQFWSPFVRSLKMDPDVRRGLESELAELNQKVLDANDSFGAVEDRLKNTGNLVPLARDDAVGIEAIPSRLFDIMSRTQVMLSSVTGARLPIGRHGEGTQSLAVICLFDAFLQTRLEDTYREHSSPIVALEEPEAHLHPSATHSVAALLQELPGQKILATHSGDLVGGCPITSLRRLRRKDGEITVYRLEEDVLNEDQIRKINHHIRASRGSALFARCWLLIEGEADRLIFEGCARVLGRDLLYEGVSCIEFQQIGIGVDVLTKFADSMGIEWHVVGDNDNAGNNYVEAARKQIGSRDEQRHISQLQYGDLELFLCMEGYGSLYEGYVAPDKKVNVTAEPGTPAYWKQVTEGQINRSKTRAAVEVVEEMEKRGNGGVPEQFREIIGFALELAEEARDG